MLRRTFLAGGAGALAAAVLGPARAAAEPPLSAAALALLEAAWRGLDPSRVVDCHVHLVGVGDGGTGCYVNPKMRSPWHPLGYLRYRVFMSAGGVRDAGRADGEYLSTLVERLSARPGPAGARHGRAVILALDAVHGDDGRPDWEATELATPDEYVLETARRHPELFLAGISVHPSRPDAEERLERGAARGAVLVKWLPNAQRIDPASPRCDPFYRRLAALRMPLLVHTGEERAVGSAGGQHLGHPQRLRRALDHGVTVIAAHCASLGEYEDFDAPGAGRAPAFRLFMRMLRERRPGRLYGDISALTHFNRLEWLRETLENVDIHDRLLYASDYPLPAVNFMVHLGRLAGRGLLDGSLLAPLRELYARNPLWFDLALKRSLAFHGRRLPAECFMPAWLATSPGAARPPEPRSLESASP